MEDCDPEMGTEGRMEVEGAGTPQRTSLIQGIPSDSFLEKQQRLFKSCPTKNKEFKSLDQVTSALMSFTEDDNRKLLQERDDSGNTALHYAVQAGNLDVCKQLCKCGADINARGQNKMTVLQFAARYGDGMSPEDVWQCMQ